MDTNNFPHHTGGVVQVRHTTRYGVVPEALLEDSRLSLDSRAVAAWLAVKQDGWQILVGVLRTRLGHGGQALLGKDRWQRIANELESAGYLTRKKINGHVGRWSWHITFTPVPEHCTGAVFAGSGSTSHGLAVAGLPGAGKRGHKVISRSEVPEIVTTTTEHPPASNPEKKGNSRGFAEPNCTEKLHYPKVGGNELAALEKLMSHCSADSRQNVLDEIEGIRQAGGIKRGIVPLAKALIGKVAAGDFSLSAGHSVQGQRERRAKHQLACSVSVAPIGTLSPMSEADIAKLPPNIARRVREHAAHLGTSDHVASMAPKVVLP